MIQIRTSRTILVQASDTSAKGYHHRTSIVQLAQLLLDFRNNSKVQLLRLGQRNNVNPRGSEISSEGAETLKQQANMFRNLYAAVWNMEIDVHKNYQKSTTADCVCPSSPSKVHSFPSAPPGEMCCVAAIDRSARFVCSGEEARASCRSAMDWYEASGNHASTSAHSS